LSTTTTWVDNQGNDLNPLTTSEDELKVISYNILGPLHGESSKHFYAPTSITKWTRRRDKLLVVIKSTHADVVCLQEVSHKALKETFIPGLKSMGLKLSSYAASKFSQTNKFSRGHKQIGCAIFVRDNKIQTVAVRNVHLKYVSPIYIY
jgi:mRNA deadenylase 3'-5' endonuclease subunit Ccr4